MGVGRTFAEAFVKSQRPLPAPICRLPARSSSACASNRKAAVEVAQVLHRTAFTIVNTAAPARRDKAGGIPVTDENKVNEGRPNIGT